MIEVLDALIAETAVLGVLLNVETANLAEVCLESVIKSKRRASSVRLSRKED